MTIIEQIKTIDKGLKTHPLAKNVGYKRKILKRMCWWQISKSQYRGGMELLWINGRKLMVYPGRASSTGNFYYGLLEYEPMSFAYHYISKNDVFFDIGANVGAYSILAKAAEKVVSFEPADDTRNILKQNYTINEIDGIIVEKGVSDRNGKALFTQDRDCVNHIVSDSITILGTEVTGIDVVNLDSYISKSGIFPTIIKIDAEGSEKEIIKGAKDTFSHERLNVIIMEIFDDEALSDMLIEKGFHLYQYEPKTRELIPGTLDAAGGTGIYIRNVGIAQQQVSRGMDIIYQGDNLTLRI